MLQIARARLFPYVMCYSFDVCEFMSIVENERFAERNVDRRRSGSVKERIKKANREIAHNTATHTHPYLRMLFACRFETIHDYVHSFAAQLLRR